MTEKQALAKQLHQAADQYADLFLPTLLAIEYREGGILPSEMLLFLIACKLQSVTHVVESGRCFGYSTEILAASGFHVISIDTVYSDVCDRLKKYSNVEMRRADGNHEVARAVSNWGNHRMAVLLDGPKGVRAFNIFAQVYNKVALAAIHDLHAIRDDGKRNLSNELALARCCYLSESAEWVDRFGWLDEDAVKIAKHESRKSLTSYGYWLGVFPAGRWAWQSTES